MRIIFARSHFRPRLPDLQRNFSANHAHDFLSRRWRHAGDVLGENVEVPRNGGFCAVGREVFFECGHVRVF